jgi:hypothetical protein
MQNDSSPADDLRDLEHRLAGWQPTCTGLDADAMLFAAGQASRRGLVKGSLTWPSLALTMTCLCLALTTWLMAERAERRQLECLLVQLSRQPTPSSDSPIPAIQGQPGENYVTIRNRVLEEGFDAPASARHETVDPPVQPVHSAPVFHAGQRDGMNDY